MTTIKRKNNNAYTKKYKKYNKMRRIKQKDQQYRKKISNSKREKIHNGWIQRKDSYKFKKKKDNNKLQTI